MLEALIRPDAANVAAMAVRAQYGPGRVGGVPVPGYRQEPGVAPDSRTETYAALRLRVSTTGAGRECRSTCAPASAFRARSPRSRSTSQAGSAPRVPPRRSIGVQPNMVVLTVQPDEGVSVSLGAKIPGTLMRIRPVIMEFRYGTAFLSESPEAYERRSSTPCAAMRRCSHAGTRSRLCGASSTRSSRRGGGTPHHRSPSIQRDRRGPPRPTPRRRTAAGGVGSRHSLARPGSPGGCLPGAEPASGQGSRWGPFTSARRRRHIIGDVTPVADHPMVSRGGDLEMVARQEGAPAGSASCTERHRSAPCSAS